MPLDGFYEWKKTATGKRSAAHNSFGWVGMIVKAANSLARRRAPGKAQLAFDRTSCRSPLADQMRLILHTAAYWLMLTVRDVIPKAHALAAAEFATLRLRLLKLGARVIERASRVRLAFAVACPDATLIRHIAAALMPTGP